MNILRKKQEKVQKRARGRKAQKSKKLFYISIFFYLHSISLPWRHFNIRYASTLIMLATTKKVVQNAARKSDRKRTAVALYDDASESAKSPPKKSRTVKDSPPPTDDVSEPQNMPTRAANGEFIFADHPEFRPNMSPEEVLRGMCVCMCSFPISL
jgi:hypothetical protein